MNRLADFKPQFGSLIINNFEKITFTLIALIIIASIHSVYIFVGSYGKKNKIHPRRTNYITKLISILLVLIFVIFLLILWGINYHGLLIFASTVFTVLGIALFATWSVLSNVVSSVIIFLVVCIKLVIQ